MKKNVGEQEKTTLLIENQEKDKEQQGPCPCPYPCANAVKTLVCESTSAFLFSYSFDYILIDCPPALGLLTLNALVAAHSVLVPLQCEFFALEGISHLVRTINRGRKAYNPSLDIQGIVLTMFDRRNNLSDSVALEVRDHFGDIVYDTVIPRNVRVSEAPSYGKPVLLYDTSCAGSQAYIHLASEVLRREQALAA